jgi:uncharacterized protein
MRSLILLLLGIVAIGLLRAWLNRRPQPPKASPTAGAPTPEDMVRCAHCQVHLARSEAITHRGLSYCSPEHLPSHPSSPP